MAEKPTTIGAVVLAIVVTIAGPGFRGWRAYQRMHAREAAEQAKAAAERAAADRSRAEEIRRESEIARARASEERSARADTSLQMALDQLHSDHPMSQCDGALALGRMGASNHIEDLRRVLADSSAGNARNCAASALVTLGDRDTAWAAYREWAAGTDSDLQRAAVMGFGDIGPDAAPDAMRYLYRWADSPQMSDRYLAVETLAKLGPAAMPLLERMANDDADKMVRDRALAILRASATQ
jgi:hypothetical protein